MFLGAWLLSAGGCTCIIDADKYRGGGDGDAGEIDAADNLPDAGPPDARLESDAGPIEPTSALEGEGSGTGAPPVMIVLRGTFAAGATVRVVRDGDDTDLVVEPAVVSGNGQMLAFGIRIPVYDDVDEGEIATLAVFIDDDLFANFTVDGLLEADLSDPIDTTTLRPLYSQIVVSSNVALSGASPAILRSTTDIAVEANLDGDGRQSGASGPGGCTGGAAGSQGECGVAGGAGGSSALVGEGGAGGGHAEVGSPGTGGAVGGQERGNDLVTPLVNDGGNGGGGGGSGTLGAGRDGGGGGGVVELSAAGTVTLDGIVNVAGGPGSIAPAAGVCGVSAPGGSGGGSGGAILIRALGITGAGSLDARAGAGATRDTCNAGGDGSPGRIRIDVATEELPELTANPAPVRGPHWAEDTPYLVRVAAFTATLYGEPNRSFAANVDGSNRQEVPTNPSGVGTYMVNLEPGHNRICAIVSETAPLNLPEAVRCMIVTYVPE